jgi:hypothetical protein
MFYDFICGKLNVLQIVATPLWAKCEGEAHTPKVGSWSPPGVPKT